MSRRRLRKLAFLFQVICDFPFSPFKNFDFLLPQIFFFMLIGLDLFYRYASLLEWFG